MSIETDLFPVTAADGDVGTTKRRYVFQGASEAAVGDDGSANASDLENADDGNAMTYQEPGYGQVIHTDGDDEAVETVASVNSYMLEQSANVTHTNTTEMTIEGIIMFDAWFSASWKAIVTAIKSTGIDGWAVIGARTTDGQRIAFATNGSTNRITATVSAAAFPVSDGDWIYYCGTYDSSEVGNDRAQYYFGNLTNTTADVVGKTATDTRGAGGFDAYNTKMRVGSSELVSYIHKVGFNTAVLRIQDKAFSLATVQTRYDDIKAWQPVAPPVGGVGNLINGGLINTGLVGGRLV